MTPSQVKYANTCAALAVASLLSSCGGGGGNPGVCSGSAVYCAEFGSGSGSGSSDGGGVLPQAFMRTGSGDTVLTLPSDVSRLRIQASYAGTGQNFVVKVAGQFLVNELVGTSQFPTSFDGTYVVSGGQQVEILNASGVNWTLTQLAAETAPTTSPFAKSGQNDNVFELPARSMNLRVQASYTGPSSNFVMRVRGTVMVNTLIGSAQAPTSHDGTLNVTGGTVEILNSSGVTWSVTEVQ